MRGRTLRLVLCVAALCGILVLSLECRTRPGPSGGAGANTNLCGECLDLPSAEVCTSEGPVRNSCVAICRQIKIECNYACPCAK